MLRNGGADLQEQSDRHDETGGPLYLARLSDKGHVQPSDVYGEEKHAEQYTSKGGKLCKGQQWGAQLKKEPGGGQQREAKTDDAVNGPFARNHQYGTEDQDGREDKEGYLAVHRQSREGFTQQRTTMPVEKIIFRIRVPRPAGWLSLRP
jgi:hypothetical protein